MALYHIQGVAPIRWSMLINDGIAGEWSSDAAVGIAVCPIDLRQSHGLRDAPHQGVGSPRLIKDPAPEMSDGDSSTEDHTPEARRA